jgi:integrase/recombinase XerD
LPKPVNDGGLNKAVSLSLVGSSPTGRTIIPVIVATAGENAARRYLEFFAVTIENPNTRQAYFHACRRFFDWCEHKGLDELIAIEPMHVAA